MRQLCTIVFLGAGAFSPMALMGQSTPAAKTPAASTAPPNTSSLAGLSFAAGDWNTKMPTGRHLRMLCYALKPANSASLPFTLEPAAGIDKNANGQTPPCQPVAKRKTGKKSRVRDDDDHPLLQRQTVILVIDVRKAGDSLSNIKVLNFNLTSTSAAPLNPAPLRPSATTSSIAVQNAGPSVFYFRWPIQLIGDT